MHEYWTLFRAMVMGCTPYIGQSRDQPGPQLRLSPGSQMDHVISQLQIDGSNHLHPFDGAQALGQLRVCPACPAGSQACTNHMLAGAATLPMIPSCRRTALGHAPSAEATAMRGCSSLVANRFSLGSPVAPAVRLLCVCTGPRHCDATVTLRHPFAL